MVASHGLQKGHKNVCKRGIKRDVNQAEVGAFRSACMLISVGIYVYLGRDTCVPRSGYMCTSVGVHVYLGRGTCVPRSGYDDHQASLTRQRGFPLKRRQPFLPFYLFTFLPLNVLFYL